MTSRAATTTERCDPYASPRNNARGRDGRPASSSSARYKMSCLSRERRKCHRGRGYPGECCAPNAWKTASAPHGSTCETPRQRVEISKKLPAKKIRPAHSYAPQQCTVPKPPAARQLFDPASLPRRQPHSRRVVRAGLCCDAGSGDGRCAACRKYPHAPTCRHATDGAVFSASFHSEAQRVAYRESSVCPSPKLHRSG